MVPMNSVRKTGSWRYFCFSRIIEEVTPNERGFADTIRATVNIVIFVLYIFSGY